MKSVGLITDIAFWDLKIGQNARIYSLYRFLSDHCQLILYYLGEEVSPFSGPAFQTHDKRSELLFYLNKAKHDFVIVERLHLDWVVDLGVKGTAIYLDALDLVSDREKSFQQFNRSYTTVSFEEEISRLDKFDKIIFLQKDELEKVSSRIEKDKLLLCPHPVEIEEGARIRKEVETISFLGGPSWPNIDAIQWFHDEVLPRLGDLASKCVVHGSCLYSPFSRFSPRLNKGQLFSSLDHYYKAIDIAINPVLYGSGLKIKTVEALAYGVPLVTTSIGVQGLSEEKGRCFLLADTAEEFAHAIHRLVSSWELRQEISSAARHFAQEKFSFSACFTPLL